MKLHIELYRDRKKEWRWRMRKCGRIVADCGEGYKRRHTMERVLSGLIKSIKNDSIVLRDFTA